MLVLCDFDGTISEKDITNLVLDNLTGTGWRTKILPEFHARKISHFELMTILYGDVTASPDELRAIYKNVPIRAHFAEFVKLCEEQQWPLVIVSGGLEFYIQDFLPPQLPFHSYKGEFDEATKTWHLSRPDWPELREGEDFKVRIFEELRQQHPEAGQTVFIGDGLNDYKVASEADYIFAVKGKRLAQMCREEDKPFTEFDDFAQVMEVLTQESEGKNDER